MIRILEKSKVNVKALEDIDENACHILHISYNNFYGLVITLYDGIVLKSNETYSYAVLDLEENAITTIVASNDLKDTLQLALNRGFEVYEFPTRLEMYQWLARREAENDDVKPTNIEPHQDYSYEELDNDLQELAQEYFDDGIDETEPNYYYKQ
jgi:hypothetical protein